MRNSFSVKNAIKIIIATFVVLGPVNAIAQSPFGKFPNLFTVPNNYVVNYVSSPPVIDGELTDAVWQQAKWTGDFRDIEGDLKPNPPLRTRVKMLWGDSCLYIAAQISDPHVWATLKQHDEIIFRDNDFEVFIDPSNTTHQYFELEFNALNTVFDLFLNKPYRNNGNAMINWDAKGLHSAVKVQGSLNDPTDTDQSWTIEIAIPFKAISLGNNVQVPVDGTLWRINFSRVEWDTKVVNGKHIKLKDSSGRNLPEHNWVWSPQGVINMHYPERWGYLHFSKDFTNNKPFIMPYPELQKQYLWLVYYHEKLWLNGHHTYQQSLKKFGIKSKVIIDTQPNTLKIEATKHQFMAFITDGSNITWAIDQEGLIRRLTAKSDE
ncbi:MAG: hypothetical protein JWP44_2197 [Mucilaginibacter sp.]|nr:hypothetical protein [Mucilaginibacter sp.]